MKKTAKSDSQYVGVFLDKRKKNQKSNSKHRWKAQATAPNGDKLSVYLATEKEAARAVDLFKLRHFQKPVNGLEFKGIRKV